MTQANERFTILYGRLSQDDGSQGDSNSIQNQRLMLEKFAKENGFTNTKFLCDDGVSGTSFNRPAWNEIMSLVESNQVSTIIVKDLSRFAREHLGAGQLLDFVFPDHDVRFIAMNDNIDSIDESSTEFVPMRNWFKNKRY